MPPNSHPALRPLLRAGDHSAYNGAVPPTPPAPAPPSFKQTESCETCRRRKTKCDRGSPKCSTCVAKGWRCVYDPTIANKKSLRRRFGEVEKSRSSFEELFDLIRNTSEVESQDIFRSVRAGVDPESILRRLKDGHLLLQLNLQPDRSYRYVCPLVDGIPAPMHHFRNPYVEALVHQPAYSGSTGPASQSSRSASRINQDGGHLMIPYHAVQLVDPLLSMTRPSHYTSITSNDTLMRSLLEAFFLHEYATFPCFQKDLFLGEMVARGTELCSPLLVNALLAKSCQVLGIVSDRAQFWNPHTLGYQFMGEARRLWELEAGMARLTTIQAAIIMNATYSMSGLDRVGRIYIHQAISMAHKMGLFAKTTTPMDPKAKHARDFTAWCLFCFSTKQDFYYYQPPPIDISSLSPLPHPTHQVKWYGDILIKYPTIDTVISINFPSLFKAYADLVVIIGQLAWCKYGNSQPGRSLPFSQARQLYATLVGWMGSLPEVLAPRSVSLPSQFSLHLDYLHIVDATIVQPFRDTETMAVPVDDVDMNLVNTVALESSAQLETLVRLYYMRHGFEHYHSMLLHHLSVVGFNTLSRLGSVPAAQKHRDALRSTLLICAKGLYIQTQNYYIATVILSKLLPLMQREDRSIFERFAVSQTECPSAHEERISDAQAVWSVRDILSSAESGSAESVGVVNEYAARF